MSILCILFTFTLFLSRVNLFFSGGKRRHSATTILKHFSCSPQGQPSQPCQIVADSNTSIVLVKYFRN